MSDLQESLLGLDARLEKVQKLAKAVASAVARARTTVKTGELAEKDSDYNEDVAAIWAIGLRDGATPAKPKGK